MKRTRRSKKLLLVSAALSAGTLLTACGNNVTGNPKGPWYDAGGYDAPAPPPDAGPDQDADIESTGAE